MNSRDVATIEKFAREKMREFGLLDAGWAFKWTNAKKSAGTTRYRYDKRTSKKIPIDIRISKYLLSVRGVAKTKETVLHEIAHALAPHNAHHNWKWKQIARKVGAKPERCYKLEESEAAKIDYNWHLVCNSCNKKYGYIRRPKVGRSCGECDRKYNPKYQLTLQRA